MKAVRDAIIPSWTVSTPCTPCAGLVGFNLSPCCGKSQAGPLGRAMLGGPALRLICEREDESRPSRRDTGPSGRTPRRRPGVQRQADQFGGERSANSRSPTVSAQRRSTRPCKPPRTASWTCLKGRSEATQTQPGSPFTTSTLQQEAARKLALPRKAHEAHRPAVVRGRGYRRRCGRPDHLHAYRFGQPGR